MSRFLEWTRGLDDKWSTWVVLIVLTTTLAVALWIVGDHARAVIGGVVCALFGAANLAGALDLWPVRYRRGRKFRGRSSGGWDRLRP